jgi:predicted DsbA family dithiol-disulfide isomerase
MGHGGQDITEQQAQIRDSIRERGASVGFTFNAHRLLHWAGEEHPDQQPRLKMALLNACHRDRKAMDDSAVLLQAVATAGLDTERARAILAGNEFSEEVRQREALYLNAGIHSVPAVVINEQHLVSGGQPVEVYERVIRELAEG